MAATRWSVIAFPTSTVTATPIATVGVEDGSVAVAGRPGSGLLIAVVALMLFLAGMLLRSVCSEREMIRNPASSGLGIQAF